MSGRFDVAAEKATEEGGDGTITAEKDLRAPGGAPDKAPGKAPGGAPGKAPGGAPGKAPGGAPGKAPGGAPGDSSARKATVVGRTIDRSAAIKFAGLIAFIAIVAIVVVAMWPYIADVFTEGGVDRLVERVRNAGVGGVFILLGMQLLQIIVAFIPGEVVQLAAGLMYGPWLGALIVLVGCVISSAIVYQLVHLLGAPFVQSMVSTEHLEKFRAFEKSGKLDVVVFILFLIPAMPKDVFTYIVPLTDMKMGRFLLLTTIGRIPGVLASTFVAHGFSEGNIVGPIVIVAVVAVIALVAVVFRDKIMDALSGRG